MTPWFVVTLILNLAVVAIYLVLQLLRNKTKRKSCILKACVMIVCPVVGPVCYFIAYLFWLFSRQSVDLEDVIFSKQRVKTYRMPEEHKEMNMVSMEDALVVSDRESLRNLMLNVVCDDDGEALNVISKGLQAEDSETSHYAASVLQDKLGVFRRRVQNTLLQLQTEEDTEVRAARAAELLDYMLPMLKRNVFSEKEAGEFVRKMDELDQYLLASEKNWFSERLFDDLFHVALAANEDAIAEKWCGRLMGAYHDSQNAYCCRLELYYKLGRREAFKETMAELKKSDVVVDAQLLEWIRIFG